MWFEKTSPLKPLGLSKSGFTISEHQRLSDLQRKEIYLARSFGKWKLKNGSILSASSWGIFGWVITGWWYYWMHTHHVRVVSCLCRISHRVENEVGEQAKEAKLTSLGHTLSTTNSVPTEKVHSQGNTPRPSCLNAPPPSRHSILYQISSILTMGGHNQ